jgi:hypothetical protein
VVDEEAERDRLWALADRVFPAFARFRRDAAEGGRSVPIIRLTPRETRATSDLGVVSSRADSSA